MVNIKRWLLRVPLWVWLFIVFTQLISIPAWYYRMNDLAKSIADFGEDPNKAEIKVGFQDQHDELRQDIINAFIVAPIALGLAYWKWSQEKVSNEAMPNEHQTV
jgi:hypothetical protein